MYGAKDPTETTGDISVQMWIMWNPFLKTQMVKENYKCQEERTES